MRFLVLLVNLVPYHLARWGAVAQQGHEVTVLQRRTGDCFKVLETNPTAAPFAVHTLQEPGPSVPALRRQVALWIETVAPEVVVVSGYSFAESLAALTAAAYRSLPVVLCSESNRHDGVRQPLGEWVKRRIVRHAQAALVGGADHAAYLQELGMDAAAIFRGYNAVDNDHFASARRWRQRGKSARLELGLPPRYLLAASRFTEKKNLVGLIQGYGLWRGQATQAQAGGNPGQPDVSLVIVGDGPLRGALEAQVTALGLEGWVHLPGACAYDALPAHYGLAEALVHASTVEQWGLVVNEAMASGLPVLVSRACGSAPELVMPGENGFVFDPSTPAAIAAAISWFLEQPEELRQRMGEASQRMIKRLHPEAFARGLEAAGCHALATGSTPLKAADRTLLYILGSRSESSG